MKNKIFLFLFLTLTYVGVYSQEYVIQHCVENRKFYSNDGLICSNEDRTKWFMVQIIYKSNSNYPIVDGLSVIKVNIGASDSGDLLVITFTDNTNIKVKARTGLLEYGTVVFDLTNKDMESLVNKSVVSLRFINGRDYKSLTYYTKNHENIFFLNALSFYTLKRIKCE